jgi:nucleotide-binding universal stress UspA family protein
MGYRTILVPLDGSPLARLAIAEAKKLAEPGGARIILLGVVEFPTAQFEGYADFVSGFDIHERIRKYIEQFLTKEIELLHAEGYQADYLVREGFPHEEIAAACEDEKVEIIVMTTHGRTGFAHWILGSVAEKVVRSAPCSVLIVRPSSEEIAADNALRKEGNRP